ncbi:unnamed protein product [Peniophora sp. CBMAI 1063]|nr:unnamed protein product [Peniophora sp. CBMAI 1063]
MPDVSQPEVRHPRPTDHRDAEPLVKIYKGGQVVIAATEVPYSAICSARGTLSVLEDALARGEGSLSGSTLIDEAVDANEVSRASTPTSTSGETIYVDTSEVGSPRSENAFLSPTLSSISSLSPSPSPPATPIVRATRIEEPERVAVATPAERTSNDRTRDDGSGGGRHERLRQDPSPRQPSRERQERARVSDEASAAESPASAQRREEHHHRDRATQAPERTGTAKGRTDEAASRPTPASQSRADDRSSNARSSEQTSARSRAVEEEDRQKTRGRHSNVADRREPAVARVRIEDTRVRDSARESSGRDHGHREREERSSGEGRSEAKDRRSSSGGEQLRTQQKPRPAQTAQANVEVARNTWADKTTLEKCAIVIPAYLVGVPLALGATYGALQATDWLVHQAMHVVDNAGFFWAYTVAMALHKMGFRG